MEECINLFKKIGYPITHPSGSIYRFTVPGAQPYSFRTLMNLHNRPCDIAVHNGKSSLLVQSTVPWAQEAFSQASYWATYWASLSRGPVLLN